MRAATAHNRDQQVIEALEGFNADLDDSLRQQKYSRMSASAFSFFRGSNHLYWQDLYRDWHFSLFGGVTATQTWLQGDAHLHNFGAYGSHDDRVRFGLDDFDDGIVGDYQYDLWRLLTSVVLAVRESDNLKPEALPEIQTALIEAYLETLQGDTDTAADWAAMADTTDGKLQAFLIKLAGKKDRQRMLDKWTCCEDGHERRFQPDHPKLAALGESEKASLEQALTAYQATLNDEVPGHSRQHFKVKDVARRLSAGTGSLGTDRFYALVEGQGDGDHDDVILDIKAQQPPAAWWVMNTRERSEYARMFAHEGERHARAFQAMARHPDPYVGWLELGDQVFSVRERSPFKADYPTDKLHKPKHWKHIAKAWGRILAASHLRGARALSEGGAQAFADGVLARALPQQQAFTDLLLNMAQAYADCVRNDYEAFCRYLQG
ncbi:DUF2252 domain-containing protein [Marinobacterium weihaiense]|uniref:DUF2252 domain-containing protein n=1 Tax=Marinobacterium weihaiense TaxID=2851016 RepID=A0ABS6MBI5_9GAMM|nr:DUF2252 family protein [Marinobacterium weihaiense]MBV0933635.1 DUF2252 domain-containing protein [Marinobacterium weihaiense]